MTERRISIRQSVDSDEYLISLYRPDEQGIYCYSFNLPMPSEREDKIFIDRFLGVFLLGRSFDIIYPLEINDAKVAQDGI